MHRVFRLDYCFVNANFTYWKGCTCNVVEYSNEENPTHICADVPSSCSQIIRDSDSQSNATIEELARETWYFQTTLRFVTNQIRMLGEPQFSNIHVLEFLWLYFLSFTSITIHIIAGTRLFAQPSGKVYSF